MGPKRQPAVATPATMGMSSAVRRRWWRRSTSSIDAPYPSSLPDSSSRASASIAGNPLLRPVSARPEQVKGQGRAPCDRHSVLRPRAPPPASPPSRSRCLGGRTPALGGAKRTEDALEQPRRAPRRAPPHGQARAPAAHGAIRRAPRRAPIRPRRVIGLPPRKTEGTDPAARSPAEKRRTPIGSRGHSAAKRGTPIRPRGHSPRKGGRRSGREVIPRETGDADPAVGRGHPAEKTVGDADRGCEVIPRETGDADPGEVSSPAKREDADPAAQVIRRETEDADPAARSSAGETQDADPAARSSAEKWMAPNRPRAYPLRNGGAPIGPRSPPPCKRRTPIGPRRPPRRNGGRRSGQGALRGETEDADQAWQPSAAKRMAAGRCRSGQGALRGETDGAGTPRRPPTPLGVLRKHARADAGAATVAPAGARCPRAPLRTLSAKW